MNTSANALAPIGIYDSGLGGLSVVRQIQRLLPQESVLYLADTARVPYGGRSAEEIRGFSLQILDYFAAQGVKLVLCACNTSSVLILPEHQVYRGIPVLGLAQAGARLAAARERLALLATEATVRSGGYVSLVRQASPETEILPWPCPDFVPLVESGDWHSPAAQAVVERQLAALRAQTFEAVLLGCSHYPYLGDLIQRALGPLPLLDPAEILAQQTAEWLLTHHLLAPEGHRQDRFETTGDPASFAPLAARALNRPVSVSQIELPESLLPAAV